MGIRSLIPQHQITPQSTPNTTLHFLSLIQSPPCPLDWRSSLCGQAPALEELSLLLSPSHHHHNNHRRNRQVFFPKFSCLSKIDFFGGDLVRPHSQNLSSPISDFSPPLIDIAINAKSAKPPNNFQTLPRWNRMTTMIYSAGIMPPH